MTENQEAGGTETTTGAPSTSSGSITATDATAGPEGTTAWAGAAAGVLDQIRAAREALTVRRVFGDPYELDGVTLVPVAVARGGAGGGGGEGTKPGEDGRGFGSGFGVDVRPVGVFEIRNGEATWKPAVDVNRIVRGGQVLGGIMAVCIALVLLRRR